MFVQLAALKHELIQSEAERIHLSQQCDMYADLSDKQKLLCGTSVREVHKLEDSLQAVENERDAALAHCRRLEELLGRAENQLKVSQAQCDVLQEVCTYVQLICIALLYFVAFLQYFVNIFLKEHGHDKAE